MNRHYTIALGDGPGLRRVDSWGGHNTVYYNGHTYETHISAFKILGYIPGCGVITGIARIFMGCLLFCVNRSLSERQIIRGLCEFIGIGICFLPFDLGWLTLEEVPKSNLVVI